MRAFQLTRSSTPLSTTAVLELFQKIDGRLSFSNFEPILEISPASGELFIIEDLEGAVEDGQEYVGGSDIFHESKFDVVIDRTREVPKMFRFMYYNRHGKYRLAHYLVCDQKTGGVHYGLSSTATDKVFSGVMKEYGFVQNAIFGERAEEGSEDLLDMAFWKDLVSAHIKEISSAQ
ncbi:uncharacterized protein NEMAJ01_1694 [Nematocida major]|uniref:uncharacterized protein n=1 Tax=Nematocida major TaxID=1912982 RepID=UPI0020083E3F|nr:uncharacterized protein NEMAJ01_1694 [Nematocida major]KAH9386798.1 hypothetical protein NEMAJ01_1694 [Nematocida major]